MLTDVSGVCVDRNNVNKGCQPNLSVQLVLPLNSFCFLGILSNTGPLHIQQPYGVSFRQTDMDLGRGGCSMHDTVVMMLVACRYDIEYEQHACSMNTTCMCMYIHTYVCMYIHTNICTVEHSCYKPEIPAQAVCDEQEFIISEQFSMRYCST